MAMAERSLVGAKIWYGISMGAPGFIVPFLNLFYRRIGMNEQQIGVLSAIKPWVAAAFGNVLCAIADKYAIHMLMLMSCYISVTALQTSMALFTSFAAQLGLAIVAAAVSSPWGVISDAAVMAAVTRPGAYGETRVWASVMWGVLSPIAGAVNTYLGLTWGFIIYAIVSAVAIIPGCFIPTDALAKEVAAEQALLHQQQHPSGKGTASENGAPAKSPLAGVLTAPVRTAFEEAVEEMPQAFAEARAVAEGANKELRVPLLRQHQWAQGSQTGGPRQGRAAESAPAHINRAHVSGTTFLGQLFGGSSFRPVVPSMPVGLQYASGVRAAARDTFAVLGVPPPGQFYSQVPFVATTYAQQHHLLAPPAFTEEASEKQPAIQAGSRRPTGDGSHWGGAMQTPTSIAARFGNLPPGESLVATEADDEASEFATTDVLTHTERASSMHGALTPSGIPVGAPKALRKVVVQMPPSHAATSPPASVFAAPWSPAGFQSPAPELLEPAIAEAEAQEQQNAAAGGRPPLSLFKQHSVGLSDLKDGAVQFSRKSRREQQRSAALKGKMRVGSATSVRTWLATAETDEGAPQDEAYDDAQYDDDEEEQRPKSEPGDAPHVVAARSPFAASPPEGPATPPNETVQPQPKASAMAASRSAAPNLAANIRLLLSNGEVVVFFTICTLLGFGHSIIGTFLFLYLDNLGGTELLMGLVLAANSFSETPVFTFFGQILHVFGVNGVLFLALGTLILRYAAYELLQVTSVWTVLPIECLHAITYAGGWSACAINSARVAPPGLEVTTQSIFQGLWLGFGGGFAGLIGGPLYQWLGPAILFRLAGVVMLLGTIICALLLKWVGTNHRQLTVAQSAHSALLDHTT